MFSHGPATVQPKISSHQSFPFDLGLLIFCVMPFFPLCFTQAYHITAFRNEIGSAYLITPMQLVDRNRTNRIGTSQPPCPPPLLDIWIRVSRDPQTTSYCRQQDFRPKDKNWYCSEIKGSFLGIARSNKHDLWDDSLNAGMCCSAAV